MIRLAIILISLLLLAACRTEHSSTTVTPSTPTSSPVVSATVTASPTSLPSPIPTRQPIRMPSPTYTPTPTAQPVTVGGNPRNVILSTPFPAPNAPCGIVDVLDFPLDPPHASQVSFGGQDFGIFRRRFNGYHTGEDWWENRGRSNFGVPVYSVGHGTITYAEPFGWGRDKGVVIIRYQFSDDSDILSFYGHLDPSSVTLNAGACVLRGELIGKIGDPTSGPHLHFEIRTHMPTETGGGYWSDDPENSGWKPPTKFILDNRMRVAPGVRWYRPLREGTATGIGVFAGHTFLTIENGQVVAIDIDDGAVRWLLPGLERVDSALLDQKRDLLYIADRRGNIEAYRLQNFDDGNNESELDFLKVWAVDLDAIGGATLLPLPLGGVAVFVGQSSTAFSEDGQMLWRNEAAIRPLNWTQTEQSIILSSVGRDGSLWSIDNSGINAWDTSLNGKLLNLDDQIFLYNSEGIYLLDVKNRAADLIYPLPRSFLGLGDGIVLPDDGLLLAHRDLDDERLILFKGEDNPVWQRSYSQTSGGNSQLLESGGHPYLIVSNDDNFFDQVTLFSIDLEGSELTRLLEANLDSAISSPIQAFPVSEELILIYAGNGLLALDLEEAKTAASQTSFEP